jgi:hypothetical protein
MGLGFGKVLRPGKRTGPAPICSSLVMHVFKPGLNTTMRYTVQTYRRKNSAWVSHSTTSRVLEPAVIEWFQTWPTLAEKRLQSTVQRRELQLLRIAV